MSVDVEWTLHYPCPPRQSPRLLTCAMRCRLPGPRLPQPPHRPPPSHSQNVPLLLHQHHLLSLRPRCRHLSNLPVPPPNHLHLLAILHLPRSKRFHRLPTPHRLQPEQPPLLLTTRPPLLSPLSLAASSHRWQSRQVLQQAAPHPSRRRFLCAHPHSPACRPRQLHTGQRRHRYPYPPLRLRLDQQQQQAPSHRSRLRLGSCRHAPPRRAA